MDTIDWLHQTEQDLWCSVEDWIAAGEHEMAEQAQVPEGYRIDQLDEDCYVPERWDAHKHMWRSFDKGRNGYYSYKSWNAALRFIEKKEAAKRAREQE